MFGRRGVLQGLAVLELEAGPTWAVGLLGIRLAGTSPVLLPLTRILPQSALQWFSARQADSDTRGLTGLPMGTPTRHTSHLPAQPNGEVNSGPGSGPKAISPKIISRQGNHVSAPGRAATFKRRNPTAKGCRVEGCSRVIPVTRTLYKIMARLPKGPT